MMREQAVRMLLLLYPPAWRSEYGIELADAFAMSGRVADAEVFMSVGELEEFKHGHTQFDLTTGYYLLAKRLQRSPVTVGPTTSSRPTRS